MKNFTQSMNMTFSSNNNDGTHTFKNVYLGFNAFDSLCLACAELDINLDDVNDSDFDSAAIALDNFAKNSNDHGQSNITIWFD